MAVKGLRRTHYAIVAVLACLTYAPSLQNGFALDDVPAVAQDERIRDPANLPALMSGPYLTYLPAARSPYRPVTSASYAVSWWVGGGHPAVFHAVNVGLHAVASILLLALLGLLGAPVLAATLAAGLFAVHPVHVEAVAGVVGRADVLSTLFCLGALLVYLDRRLRTTTRVAGVSALYFLALASKEGAVVLPLLLLLVDVMRPEPHDDPAPAPAPALSRYIRRVLPFLASMTVVLAAFLAARRAVLGSVLQLDVASYIAVLSPGERITTAIANVTHLVRLLLFPADLSPEYGPAVIMPVGVTSASFWLGALTLVTVVAATGYGVARAISRKAHTENGAPSPVLWMAAAFLWTAAGYALVSNLIIPMPMWMAERTLYLPSVGVSLLVVGAITACHDARPAALPALHGVIALIIGVAALHAGFHSRTWANNDALFSDLVERHPESFRAQWWLGGRLVEAGDVEGGARWLAEAVDLNPNSALLTLDYARALLLTGESAEAEVLLRPIPVGAHPSRSVLLAQSLIFQERPDEAASVVREGLLAFPDEARLHDQARQLGVDAPGGG